MKKKTAILAIAAGIVLAAALAWAFSPRPVDVEATQATVGFFESTIDDDARTRIVDRYVVSAPLAGQVARIDLREGDVIEAGEVVATLTPALSPMLDDRSLREAAARVEAVQAQLERAGVRIERTRIGVEQARLELQRSEQLARDGFIAQTKLESDRLAAQAAAREQETAIQEQHIAGHDLEQARAALSALRKPAGSAGRAFALRSPVSGQVLRLPQRSEGTVSIGTPLIEVGNVAQLEIVAELLTTDAMRATLGTPVRVERWGGSGELEGRVRRIEPAAFTKVSALGVEEQRVNVIIDLTSPRSQWQALGDGFRVGVRIVTLASDQALQVPASAVFPLPAAEDRSMAVFRIEDGRARLTPVTLRARNGSAAWISDGLARGTRVIIYPPSAVRDGVRVRERQV